MPGLHQQVAAAAVQQLDQSGENDCGEAAGSSGGSGTGKEKARISGAGRSSSSSGRKKVSRPRFAFQTRSANDILDVGYRWRKYSAHPRFVVRFLDPSLNYYLVSHHLFSSEAPLVERAGRRRPPRETWSAWAAAEEHGSQPSEPAVVIFSFFS